jgi:hypothetical protein
MVSAQRAEERGAEAERSFATLGQNKRPCEKFAQASLEL